MKNFKGKMKGNKRPLKVRFVNSSFPRNFNSETWVYFCAHPHISNLLKQVNDPKGRHVKLIIDDQLEDLNIQVLKHH